ncbi:WXG100 family type VII secretion target [Nocardioides panzhihuensis]|uniref:Excreted virulence factor EspC (Type VII ESX diderm) n=1 Tax=Nocardioides panzhihuensis TaxID=860243 RepID=A0A7Z0DRB6_9ACTN|nr:hypothetical protein [Nocardioides panzhihuensis]NYI80354.1 hypothetical protein [Nocardioides panzhihuensis]
MTGYEVTVDDLRRTAGKYDTLKSDLGSSRVPEAQLSPDVLGHVELAGWLTAVMEQVGNAHVALGDGLDTLSTFLTGKAADYEDADERSAQQMTSGPWGPRPFTPGQSSSFPYGTPVQPQPFPYFPTSGSEGSFPSPKEN